MTIKFTLGIRLVLLLLCTVVIGAKAQDPFSVYLEPMTIAGLPGLHSYAYGTDGGKWLIIGGRTDGLHRRQPTSAFDVAGNNNKLIVVDPVAGQQWSAPLTSLSTALQEQLSSTNMQYHQEAGYLYCIGGYGYSATAGDHITYSNLVAIDLAGVIDAVINGTALTSFFRVQTDAAFAVTGGHLEKIYDVYQLAGGNKFDGRYNPMGGPSFTQVYTNEVRRFKIADDGTTLSVTFLPPFTDIAAFHRRDYNAIPQIMPDGKEGITVFSGVFKTTADVPFLDCVNIDSAGYAINSSFSQYYNHYHCANLPIFSAAGNEMHNLFFGGIAQYFDSAGILVQDNNVPFVKTIARVTRTSAGAMAEYKLPVEMPGLLGAGSELIQAAGVPTYANHVLKLDDFIGDTTLAGYIYGGINSSAPNIFLTNTGTQSTANSQLLKVYIVKGDGPAGVDKVNAQSGSLLKMQVYPNPNDGNLFISFDAPGASDIIVTISDVNGAVIKKETLHNLPAGNHVVAHKLDAATGIYFVSLQTPSSKSVQKVIIGAGSSHH